MLPVSFFREKLYYVPIAVPPPHLAAIHAASTGLTTHFTAVDTACYHPEDDKYSHDTADSHSNDKRCSLNE